ncbi:DUF411 domain-containing protein [Wenzhouxiangella sp. AB-CW3]|uniref:DUF411 domain-containing protein n=1 Tax=Wenzhouxiangella sp. AB-CW3 TaxID=2771012 RepID=UPI00168AFEDB|nr:DUF411 domain-containing protein [Wenzhouxiangella sp. AB-CW3]QOC22635.1 DUF411 domain-containing protein [Wenzhouxiangella sp. AB-CW3]
MNYYRLDCRSTPLLLVAALVFVCNIGFSSEPLPTVTLNLTENCECCVRWADHMEEAGFTVELEYLDPSDLQSLQETHHTGPNSDLSSCHTALVDGYVIEGHVPAEQVKSLIAERPDIVGLSVPGMPLGSPGMDVTDAKERYKVLAFDESGETYAYAIYNPNH